MFNIMRIYLDQMFNIRVANALRAEGYDVLRASEMGQARADDKEILEKSIADKRVLITLDEHFGDWVILPLSSHHGVIRIKVNPTTSEKIIKILLPFLRIYRQEEFKDHLIIISEYKAKWIMTAL
jgi:predicted nuclease of predicted toxin-antitoxin system